MFGALLVHLPRPLQLRTFHVSGEGLIFSTGPISCLLKFASALMGGRSHPPQCCCARGFQHRCGEQTRPGTDW